MAAKARADRPGSGRTTSSFGALWRRAHSRTARGGSDHQRRGETRNLGGAVSGAGMGAALKELSCRKISKSFVRRGETAKGKSVSSKTTCREMMMLLVERPRHWYPL
jgi:hypothetical protein